MTREELVEGFLGALEPKGGWTLTTYLQLGNLIAAVLPEISKRVDTLTGVKSITKALTDEQIMTVEEEAEEARRRC